MRMEPGATSNSAEAGRIGYPFRCIMKDVRFKLFAISLFEDLVNWTLNFFPSPLVTTGSCCQRGCGQSSRLYQSGSTSSVSLLMANGKYRHIIRQ
mmetsp:Transcript_40904/g.161993  ORF Transcript_40904/g.161993 Transcript_40904/m.161993 type:complete len:95 (+) Transcript_40904:193-477(+)